MLQGFYVSKLGQYKRADLIGQSSYIKNNDVVIFNEAFDNGASDKLLSNVKKNILIKHLYSAVLNQGGTKLKVAISSTVAEDGGVAIVSKYPIKEKNPACFQKRLWIR